MGKFINTNYTKTIDNLVDASKNKLNNPYYIFSNNPPTKVTYYSQNVEKSTLDQASGLYEAHVAKKSSFRYNKIQDFILYGIERISTEYNVNDFGTEAADITGEAILLPNTIEPKPGDFFSVSHVKESLLFKVNGATIDTLDNGSNFYKIDYNAELTDQIEQIEKQVEKNYNFVPNNVGTEFKSTILSEDYNLIERLESLVEILITYFSNTFFDSRLQTFVYNHDGYHMYDPFMIEFLKRNSVLKYGDEYIYVDHATAVNKTFGMDYSKTFFKSLEDCAINIMKLSTAATADLITDPNSLFVTKMDHYYMVKYFDNTPYKTRFEVIPLDIITRIKENRCFRKGSENECYNLWIAYFNSNWDYINDRIIDIIKNIEYMDNLSCFYMLGTSIFIIEQYIIKKLLS